MSLRRYHSRKRNVKPIPIMTSIIRFPAYCLSDFYGVKGPQVSGFGAHSILEATGAALTERLFEFGQDRLEFGRQRPWRVDDQKTGRGEGLSRGLRRDAEFDAQAFSGRPCCARSTARPAAPGRRWRDGSWPDTTTGSSRSAISRRLPRNLRPAVRTRLSVRRADRSGPGHDVPSAAQRPAARSSRRGRPRGPGCHGAARRSAPFAARSSTSQAVRRSCGSQQRTRDQW